jgi:imidazole glycerol phosphate synthase subunit HisF
MPSGSNAWWWGSTACEMPMASGGYAATVAIRAAPAPWRAAPSTGSWKPSSSGAGEIVLNCMGSDGVRDGYDLEQLQAARTRCEVPLVASGGAGAVAHFVDVFRQADVDAALAASAFHSGMLRIPELKQALRTAGIEVRHDS